VPSMACKVVAPTGVLFEGKADQVKGPGWEGGFGLKPRHSPYLVALKAGSLSLEDAQGGELFSLEVESGYLIVARDEVTVLVERLAEPT
jgi:F0F1-type ATP synthase epsilon subunit